MVNIAAHALVSVLFMQFCLKVGVTMWTAVAATLLFVAHPIHTEAVCFSYVQCFLLFLFSKGNKKPSQDACPSASVVASFPGQFGNKAIHL